MKPELKKKTEDTTWLEILGSCLTLIFLVVVIAVVVVATVVLGAFIFMLVWNATVFEVFGGPELTLLQAFLVSVLISMIGSVFKK